MLKQAVKNKNRISRQRIPRIPPAEFGRKIIESQPIPSAAKYIYAVFVDFGFTRIRTAVPCLNSVGEEPISIAIFYLGLCILIGYQLCCINDTGHVHWANKCSGW